MKYQIIYADPPWKYRTGNNSPHGGARHYTVMTTADIMALPIVKIADKNSILFFWATYPKLHDALHVIEAWGFEYKTVAFTWIKLNARQNANQFAFLPYDSFDTFFGIGNYTKSNGEPCLLATRGNVNKWVIDDTISNVLIDNHWQHSKKPDRARDLIVRLVGDRPRIELFARQRVDGWDAWGNEVKSDVKII